MSLELFFAAAVEAARMAVLGMREAIVERFEVKREFGAVWWWLLELKLSKKESKVSTDGWYWWCEVRGSILQLQLKWFAEWMTAILASGPSRSYSRVFVRSMAIMSCDLVVVPLSSSADHVADRRRCRQGLFSRFETA